MNVDARNLLRRLVPWAISAVALGYVFGFAIDWKSIPEVTARANLPLFLAVTVADKLLFFLVWGFIQAIAIRRLVEPVAIRRVLAVKAGAELVRTVNNSLGDAAFFYGVSQLVRGRLAAVVAVAGVPFGCHFGVLLLQATASLVFLDGGAAAHREVVAAVAFGWTVAGAILVASRFGVWERLLERLGLGKWWSGFAARDLVPFVGMFVVFAALDVLVQGLATRAFGVPIPWSALMARIPILYLAISIPSLGNFGVREIAWSNLFADYGTREELIAFALWTNTIFLLMHVGIGVLFVARAIELARGVREARREGDAVPEPLLHEAADR
ncbi:MAG: hypothetical protein R3E88_00655 [Myxococcota bacterium]